MPSLRTLPVLALGAVLPISAAAQPISFVTSWGTSGSGAGQLDDPYGVTVDGAGNVYVADSNNDRIQKFSASGTFLTQWGGAGTAGIQPCRKRGIVHGFPTSPTACRPHER